MAGAGRGIQRQGGELRNESEQVKHGRCATGMEQGELGAHRMESKVQTGIGKTGPGA
jgi:hypothetical protein